MKWTNSLPWSNQDHSRRGRRGRRGQQKTRTRQALSHPSFHTKKPNSRLLGPVDTVDPRNACPICSTRSGTRHTFRKILINTEPTGSQGSDHQEASSNTHIFKEVLGFMVAFHTLGKTPEIVHIEADDERQTC